MNLNHPVKVLAEIWNTLNVWEWHEKAGEKPENFDELPDFSRDKDVESKYTYVSPIINEIINKIGYKECLRWHHIHNLSRTNDEFEDWWENSQLE